MPFPVLCSQLSFSAISSHRYALHARNRRWNQASGDQNAAVIPLQDVAEERINSLFRRSEVFSVDAYAVYLRVDQSRTVHVPNVVGQRIRAIETGASEAAFAKVLQAGGSAKHVVAAGVERRDSIRQVG